MFFCEFKFFRRFSYSKKSEVGKKLSFYVYPKILRIAERSIEMEQRTWNFFYKQNQVELLCNLPNKIKTTKSLCKIKATKTTKKIHLSEEQIKLEKQKNRIFPNSIIHYYIYK